MESMKTSMKKIFAAIAKENETDAKALMKGAISEAVKTVEKQNDTDGYLNEWPDIAQYALAIHFYLGTYMESENVEEDKSVTTQMMK